MAIIIKRKARKLSACYSQRRYGGRLLWFGPCQATLSVSSTSQFLYCNVFVRQLFPTHLFTRTLNYNTRALRGCLVPWSPLWFLVTGPFAKGVIYGRTVVSAHRFQHRFSDVNFTIGLFLRLAKFIIFEFEKVGTEGKSMLSCNYIVSSSRRILTKRNKASTIWTRDRNVLYCCN